MPRRERPDQAKNKPFFRSWLPVAVVTLVLGVAGLALGGCLRVEPEFSGLARMCWPDQPAYRVSLAVDTAKALARLPEEYLSFSIDSSQLVGGLWWNEAATGSESGSGTVATKPIDLASPRLRAIARALAPAWLRVGGSEADRIRYDMADAGSAGTGQPDSADYRAVLTAGRWDELQDFVRATGLNLDFTVNAGAGPRSDGVWQSANARSLLEYTMAKGYRVDAWEFGNELNGYWAVHGLGKVVSQEQYGHDFASFTRLLNALSPASLAIMEGSAIWPRIGEGVGPFFHFLDQRSAVAGSLTQVVNWHYYPMQSRRAPVATRRAGPRVLLDPAVLDEAAAWAGKVRAWRDLWASGRPIWLGETGNAQFGGEPGVSDRWLGGLWWMDQLGLMARNGMEVVVRQSLAGMNYGLVDVGFNPRPDFWNSWLWKHFMGSEVYAVNVAGADGQPLAGSRLRAYAQASAGAGHALTVLLINLDEHRTAMADLTVPLTATQRVWQVTSPDIFGTEVELNGQKLQWLDGQGQESLCMPDPGPGVAVPGRRPVAVRPLSYAFVRFEGLDDPRVGSATR